VKGFLQRPESFQAEVDKRKAPEGYTKVSLERSRAKCQRRLKDAFTAEQMAFRSYTRGKVSEEVYDHECAQLRAEQTRLREEIERYDRELADMDKLASAADAVQALRQRLEDNLENASVADKEFIYEALGVKVLSFGDGAFDVELGIPMPEMQTANSSPGCIHRELRVSEKPCHRTSWPAQSHNSRHGPCAQVEA